MSGCARVLRAFCNQESGLKMKQSPIQQAQLAPGRPSMMDTSEEAVLDLSALMGTLWRGKWIVALTTVLALLLGGYYAFVAATPQFRSSAVVMLETNQESVVDLQSVVGGLAGDTAEINSELEVLRSRGLMGKVVDKLDLVSDPEFNTKLVAPSLLGSARTGLKSLLGLSPDATALPDDIHDQITPRWGDHRAAGKSLGPECSAELCVPGHRRNRNRAQIGTDRGYHRRSVYSRPDRGQIRRDRTGHHLAFGSCGRVAAGA